MIAIIIVHYGKIETTLNCLYSIAKQTTLNDLKNLIVVNNSQTDIGKIIKKKFKQVPIINNSKNLGYAAAVNIGIKLAIKDNSQLRHPRVQFFLILNNDIIVKKNFLKNLLYYAKKHRLDITSPKILDQNGNIWFDGGEIDKNRFTAGHKKGKTDFLSGCCLLIKKHVFEKIGFFDEQYFMYYEDVDFCFRAIKAGFKLEIDNKTTVYHHVKRTKKGIKLMEYYLARNHLLFLKKHAPLFVKVRELIRFPKTLWQHYRKKEYAALAGIKDFFIYSVLYQSFYLFLSIQIIIFAVYSPLTLPKKMLRFYS